MLLFIAERRSRHENNINAQGPAVPENIPYIDKKGQTEMLNKIAEIVTGEQMIKWLISCFLVAYFLYKEWPEFKRRVSAGPRKEQAQAAAGKSVADRLSHVENRIVDIDDKLARDYSRLNALEKEYAYSRRLLDESLEEREIIMRALLGALGGLQELGANGQTKEAVTEINSYLNRKAHSVEKEN